MKISIITPTWNSEKTIKRNLDSVHSQEEVVIEHIVIDNLSSDKTLQFVQESGYPVKLISEKDNGISDAFNKGIRAASGEIIAILNSDDCFTNKFTLKHVKDVFQKTGADIVHGNMLFVDGVYGTNTRKPLMCPIEVAFPFNHPAFFVKRSVYEKYGLFNESYRLAMDYEFVSRFYRSSQDCDLKIEYFSEETLTTMYAGGASWAHELRTLDECKRALVERGRWNKMAKESLGRRRVRIRIKNLLHKISFFAPITLWRKCKWG